MKVIKLVGDVLANTIANESILSSHKPKVKVK